MKLLLTIPHAVRRATAVIAALAVALLIVAALAAAPGGSGPQSAVLTADRGRAVVSIPACRAADLGVWLAVDQGNGTAGSTYYPLQLTNLSGHACWLHGFPGVSAVDADGEQLGSPAGWSHVTPARTVYLAAGATAHTMLQYADVVVGTSPGCSAVSVAFELRVYPPGQYSSTYAAFDLPVCSRPGPVFMTVGPIIPGVGTING